jgi:hypothetical protein
VFILAILFICLPKYELINTVFSPLKRPLPPLIGPAFGCTERVQYYYIVPPPPWNFQVVHVVKGNTIINT